MKKNRPQIKDIEHQFSKALHTPIKHQTSKDCTIFKNKLTSKSLSKAQRDDDFYNNILIRITDSVNNKSHVVTGEIVHIKKESDGKGIKTKTSSAKKKESKKNFNELTIQSQENLNNSICKLKKEQKKEETKKAIDVPNITPNNSIINCNLPTNEDIKVKISKMKEIMVSPLDINDVNNQKRRSYLISNKKRLTDKSDNHVQFNIINNKDYPSLITNTDAKLHCNKSVFLELAKRKNSVNIPTLKLKKNNSNANIHNNDQNDEKKAEEKMNLNNILDKLEKHTNMLVKEENYLLKKKNNNINHQEEEKKQLDEENNKKINLIKEDEGNGSKECYFMSEKKKRSWLCCIPVR